MPNQKPIEVRERAKNLCDKATEFCSPEYPEYYSNLTELIAAELEAYAEEKVANAVKEEREACAKVATIACHHECGETIAYNIRSRVEA